MGSAEFTPVITSLARDWAQKVQGWNLNALLPVGLVLADGRSVTKADGFYDHGDGSLDYSLMPTAFRVALQSVRKEFLDSCFFSIFSKTDGSEMCWYGLENHFLGTATDKRSSFGQVNLYMQFNAGVGKELIEGVRSQPLLLDAMIAEKFPFLTTRTEIKPWRRLLYLPPNLSYVNGDLGKQIEEIARRDLL